MEEYEGYLAEEKKRPSDVREALILSGIREIEEYGPAGFSLRRAATACGVSCAAPYKHFESKEAYIEAIVSYIDEKWHLLEAHILDVFGEDEEGCLLELCLASVRFWIGNPHFRAVRMMQKDGRARISLGDAAEGLLKKHATRKGLDADEAAELLFSLRSLVTGAMLMLEDGTLENTPEVFSMIRRAILKRLA